MSRRMREPFHTLIWKASVGYNDSWSRVDPEVLEKFAELIVKECMTVCQEIDKEYDGEDVLATWCASEIGKHFGVE